MKKEKAKSEKVENEVSAAEETTATEAKIIDKGVNKVGKLLKEMRLQKGYNLSDVSKKLCIRKIYLEAIEDSDYKELPPLPYGVGFIRSYADYLGLNSSNIVELYKEETNANPDKNMFVLEPQNEATVPGRKYLVISLLAIIAVYGAWYAYNGRMNDVAEDTGAAVEINETVVPDEESGLPLVVEEFSTGSENTDSVAPEETQAPAAAAVEEVAQVTVTEDSFPLKEENSSKKEETKTEAVAPVNGIVINAKQETWVEVKDGSKLYLSKVLMPGASYKVPEGEGMILSVGRVDGVEVLVNGKVTPVVQPNKKMNISLDKFLNAANH